jgi:hypothetical protein
VNKLILFFLLSLTLLNAEYIGVIEKGKMDRFENAYALISRGDLVLPVSKIGFKIQKNDIIKTFRKSSLQIRLKDNTLINIGKKTTLKVEKYIFDKHNKNKNAANLKIENGSFEIKTGRIGDDAPKNFKIKTKFSTIGLRG